MQRASRITMSKMSSGGRRPQRPGSCLEKGTGRSHCYGTARPKSRDTAGASFCASMADVYEEHPDVVSERLKLWKLIEATPWLNWLLLTKRPENILKMSPWSKIWPDNVWVGTSVGLQKHVDTRLSHLLQVPAAVRFLSAEPLLEQIIIRHWLTQPWGYRCLDWVICGGESGVNHRPFNLDWARRLREQCKAAWIPFYFKQVGGRYHDS